MKEEKLLLKIIKNYIKDPKKVVENEEIDEKELYKIAKKNKVSNFLVNWATNNCKSQTIKNRVQADYNMQIIKDTNERIELEAILNKFEEAQIETIVIKGIIMKDIYPQNYMRQMCDMDILVHYKDYKKASDILKKLEYKEYLDHKKHQNDHHLVFLKEPFYDIELHRRLIHKDNVIYEYLKDIWNRKEKYKEYKNIYQMNVEDKYIFCIAHMLKHFKNSGISIRDVLDVYLINEKYKNEFNCEKINEILEKYKMKTYEEEMKKISYKWFGNSEINEFSNVEEFILKGMTEKNGLNTKIIKSGGKNKSIIRIFFPKLETLKEQYPILEKAPIILPIIWIKRIFSRVFSGEVKNTERLKRVKQIKEFDEQEINKLKEIYQKLEI